MYLPWYSRSMRNFTRASRRVLPIVAVVCMLCLCWDARSRAADERHEGWETLFNGKDLSGWKNRHDTEYDVWTVVSEVKLDPQDKHKLTGAGKGGSEEGVLLRGPSPDGKHGVDLLTEKEFGDCEVHCEFMVPEGSNSGVYLEGEYEVQILSETAHKHDGQLNKGDCGAIYNTKPPSAQAETEPGTWQTYDIVFRAPRFDASGKKTENARFIKVVFNGKTVQENVEAPHPTGSELGAERAKGPLLLQGDHGIVAFRNIRIKPITQ